MIGLRLPSFLNAFGSQSLAGMSEPGAGAGESATKSNKAKSLEIKARK
jgi:hypothetical protein